MFQYLGIFVFSSSFVSFCRAATTEEYVSEASIYAALYPHLEGNIVSPIWICTSIQFLKIFASTDVKSTSHFTIQFLVNDMFPFQRKMSGSSPKEISETSKESWESAQKEANSKTNTRESSGKSPQKSEPSPF